MSIEASGYTLSEHTGLVSLSAPCKILTRYGSTELGYTPYESVFYFRLLYTTGAPLGYTLLDEMDILMSTIHTLCDFEEGAKRRLSEPVWEFILGYPERGDTLSGNLNAFRK